MMWLIRFAMCALYPRTDAWPGVVDTDVDAFLERFRRESTFLIWLGVVAGAVVFALTPLFTVGIPLPAFWLPKRALDRHANKITSHPVYLLRQAVFVVKMAAGLCWASHPSIRERYHLPAYPADPGTWRAR